MPKTYAPLDETQPTVEDVKEIAHTVTATQMNFSLVNTTNQPESTANKSDKKSSKRSSSTLVDDPENPGQQITKAALHQRERNRKLVDDPENPGQQTTKNALEL